MNTQVVSTEQALTELSNLLTDSISVDELTDLLANLPRRAQFVTFTSVTTPRMRKTGNPYWEKSTKTWHIRKESRVNGIVYFIYENAVNNQRQREDKTADFESRERRWGTHVDGTPLIAHKGRHYLEVKVERVFNTRYIDTRTGEEVDRNEIADFLYTRNGSGRQQVDNPVILRDYRLDRIREITVNGATLTVSS